LFSGKGRAPILKLDQKPAKIEELAKEMDLARGKIPGFEELFDLYLDCYKVQLSYLPRIRLKVKKPGKKELESLITEGKPLLNTRELSVEAELFSRAFSDIGKVILARLERHEPSASDKFMRLFLHPDLKTEDGLPPFLVNLLSFNTSYFAQLAKTLSLNGEVVFFTAFQAIGPFMEKASLSLRDKFDYEQWQRGFCPICGRKPSMAKLRLEDGLKLLQCSLCRSWWPYPDRRCTVCGNEDGETLGYLHTKEDEARKVDLCDKCKKYAKVIDCQKLGRDANLDVEDLATVYLDIAAKERGYESGGRVIYAFAVE
jgi:FdhE protein